MIFFLTPTAQFFLGLYYFNEPLVLDELVAFIFIWIAVIIYLNELRKEYVNIIKKGTIKEMANEIKSKFVLIRIEKYSIEIKLPTKILFWKFWLGKNNRPDISPQIIE